MYEISFNPLGSYIAAIYMSLLPGIVLYIVYLIRKKRKEKATDKWEDTRQYWYLPIIIPLIVYYGIIYWWLFYDQFYLLSIHSDKEWTLEYRMPTRRRVIPAQNIEAINAITGGLRTYKMARIVIITTKGRKYQSSQFGKKDTSNYLKLLRGYLKNSRS